MSEATKPKKQAYQVRVIKPTMEQASFEVMAASDREAEKLVRKIIDERVPDATAVSFEMVRFTEIE